MTAGLLARAAHKIWQPASRRVIAGQATWQTHPEVGRQSPVMLRARPAVAARGRTAGVSGLVRYPFAWSAYAVQDPYGRHGPLPCMHLSSVWQHTMLTAADCANNNVHGTQLLQHGELAPGLTTEEFAMRRQRLAEALPPDSVAILPAPLPKHMAGVVPFPYRPVSRPVLHLLAPPD